MMEDPPLTVKVLATAAFVAFTAGWLATTGVLHAHRWLHTPSRNLQPRRATVTTPFPRSLP